MRELHERAQALRSRIMKAVEVYRKDRTPNLLVGEFIDEEGKQSRHRGVYGITAWLNLTGRWFSENSQQGAERWDSDLSKLCKETLSAWIEETKDPTKVGIRDSAAHELKHIIPKICAAHDALRVVDCENVVLMTLRGYINDCATDGWGFLTTSDRAHPISTALVLRSFHHDLQLVRRTRAIQYLQKQAPQLPNVCWRLYVLNSLKVLGNHPSYGITIDIDREIKSAIRGWLALVHSNPTAISNPVNIDFHDPLENRLRYFRLSTDLMLLESLSLISGPDYLYLCVRPGRQVLAHFERTFSSGEQPPVQDTTGNRLSFSTCVDVYNLLETWSVAPVVKKNWLARQAAKLNCSKTFPSGPPGAFVLGTITLVAFLLAGLLWRGGHNRLPAFIAGFAGAAFLNLVLRMINYYSEKKLST